MTSKPKYLVILSGKGGTGKTTVVAALAHLASLEARLVLVDADVDAANLELVLAPEIKERHEFFGGRLAVIEPERCTACGTCAAVCRFEAVEATDTAYRVDPIACEGCGSCYYQCPAGAVRVEEQLSGHWQLSLTRFGPLLHAHLLAAQENSGKLVTQIKQRARELAEAERCSYVLIDGSPGIGCPAIAAASGSDLALIVTEPTIAGAHDLARTLQTAAHFRVPTVVCLNKHDLNPTRADQIEHYCQQMGVKVMSRLPFDTTAIEAMVSGRAVTEFSNGPISREIVNLWNIVRESLQDTGSAC